MPKEIIDYSNTVVYKIYCKDSSIKDIYIGHTTNFTKRKYKHKHACNSGKNIGIYNIIRENGGWENWNMVELETYNCKNSIEAKMKEQIHYEILNDSSKLHSKGCTDINSLLQNKQKCNEQDNKAYIESRAKEIADKDELIMFLIKENCEFKNMLMEQQNMMLEMIKSGTNSVTNTNTNTNCMNNSNNKTFNLQFFLNETCKDAMNMSDFIESIKLQLCDLENIGEVGFVEGISNIITNNLKAMDVTLRPVHCTDKKRETMYIKDENQWSKEDENNSRLRTAIKRVANKNIKLLPQFREKYPEYNNSYSRISDKYDKMVIEVMSTESEKEDKIIRNISKATVINK